MKRIAVIGDIHGCIEELVELHRHLQWFSLDEIWSLGDIVDRGPDSGACVSFLMENNIRAVSGNHDISIVNHYKKYKSSKILPNMLEKQKTLSQLNDAHYEWLKSLPFIAIDDKLGLILVHAGVWPKIPIYMQPENVCRAQMIHPNNMGKVRWWGADSVLHTSGKTEEENRREGFERWYRLYDYEEDVVFGHSTFSQPFVFQSPHGGKCIGIDTGSSFGGSLTACVYDSNKNFCFVSVKNKRVYCPSTSRIFWEAD